MQFTKLIKMISNNIYTAASTAMDNCKIFNKIFRNGSNIIMII